MARIRLSALVANQGRASELTNARATLHIEIVYEKAVRDPGLLTAGSVAR